MKLKSVLFGSVALGLLSFAAAGCSDDANDNGGTGGMGGDGGNGTGATGGGTGGNGTAGGGNAEGCPEHPAVSELSEGVCEIAGGTYTEDLHLVAGNEYFLAGKLFVGNDGSDTTLTVDAGVTVFGGDKTFIVIQRGAKILAEGTAAAPILFTSAAESPAAGDWGGLVINGKASTNFGSTNVQGEAETGMYGGTADDDNSGVLKYVVVQYGGNQVDDMNELNGIAFQGVGSGTEVDYVQVFASKDDGIEFFGGTVNVKHVFISNIGDDSIDWVGGWRGKAQFLAVQQWSGAGDRGIEADNWEEQMTATPYSQPTISNLTLWGNTTGNDDSTGVMLRHGTAGHLHNIAVGNYSNGCLAVEDSATTAHISGDDLSIDNSAVHCTTNFKEDGDTTVADWFAAGTDNTTETDFMLTDADNTSAPDLSPKTGSPLLSGGVVPSDSFFDAATYRGAFAEADNWAAGWTRFN